MSTNPNPGQQPDANNSYGGYGGYRPAKPSDDPYAAPDPTPQPGPTGTGVPPSDPGYVYGQSGQTGGQGQQQQQQYAYVPPSSVSGRSSYNQSQSTPDAQSRRRAFISYLGLCFTGIAIFFTERKNSYVRFHAAQSVVLFTPLLAAYIIVRLFILIPLIGFLLSPVLSCLSSVLFFGTALLWIFLMVQSYRGRDIRLPVVSEYADAFVARFSKGRSI